MKATSLLSIALFALAAPAVAAQHRLHLISAEDVGVSSAPLVQHEQAPSALRLASDLPSPTLPNPALPPLSDRHGGGGSVRSDAVGIIAILLSALFGFGLGHLLVQDRDGFVLFLIVDLVIVLAAGVLTTLFAAAGLWWFGYQGLGGLLIIISHIIQVLDVYPKATGQRLLQRARDSALLISTPGQSETRWVPTVRTLAFSF